MSVPPRDRRRVLGVLLLIPLAAMFIAPWALAHAVLVKSAPASRSVLSYSPAAVDLWFSERLEPAFSSMSVWSATGTQVDRRNPAVSGDDGRRLSVSLGDLASGTYTVRFRVLSVDGHVVESSFPFTIRSAP